MNIREFTESDYPGYLAASNAIYSDYPETETERRFQDESREAKIRWKRLIAEENGEIVGYAEWMNDSWSFHPQKFHLTVGVAPARQGAGVGKALYVAALESLAPLEPIVARGEAKETDERALRFLAERGFTENMREWESRLDPATFDAQNFAEYTERVASQGLTIKSLAELSQSDPNWLTKLHDLDSAVCADIPSPDPITRQDFEPWRKKLVENPGFWPEGYLIALDGDKFVGESVLWRSQAEEGLYVGVTGVLREYRRKGIAHALKVRACQTAKDLGVPVLKTWNATTNVGMLAINVALGFVRQPAWIVMEKTF
jgi:mycothiol synthase